MGTISALLNTDNGGIIVRATSTQMPAGVSVGGVAATTPYSVQESLDIR
jgi:hypothetical protein